MTVTIATPGDNAQLSFNGTAGQRIFAQFSNNTINANCCNGARAYILKPDGTTLALGSQVDNSPYGGVYFYNNSVIDTVTLPVSGTYTLVLAPTATETGSVLVTMYDVPPDASASLTPTSGAGSAAALTTTTPGQNLSVTFSGAAGQRIFAQFSNNTINANCCNGARAYILKPDGTTLALGSQVDNSPYGGVYFYNNSVIDTVTLPVSGTYTLVADPLRTETGNATITLYDVPADAAGTLLDGVPLSVTTTTPGQNLTASFTGTSGETVDVTFTSNTINPVCCNNSKAWILKPDGTKLPLGSQPNGAGSDTVYFFDGSAISAVTLPTTGTYTVVADPDRAKSGSVAVTFYDPPTPVTASYLMDCDVDSLKTDAYNIGHSFAQHHPGGTRLLILDFGAARVISPGVYGVKGFCKINGSYVRFTNEDILAALEKAADGVHNGYTTGTVLIAYGNNSSYMTADGMSADDAYWSGYYQEQRAEDLANYENDHGYNKQTAVIAGDYELGWESAAMTKSLVNGASDYGFALDYDFGSADGCPFTFDSQHNTQNCANTSYTWSLGDAAYVSYHGIVVPLPEIYYLNPDMAQQWTVIRKWWNKWGPGGYAFWGTTGEPVSNNPPPGNTPISPGAGWARLAKLNPGSVVQPELVCFGC